MGQVSLNKQIKITGKTRIINEEENKNYNKECKTKKRQGRE
jgi:hypothetical protein